MRHRALNLLTAFSLAAGCVLLVWGFLYDKVHAAGWPGVAEIGIVSFTPGSVSIRTSSGNELSAPPWALALLVAVTPHLVHDLKAKLGDRRRAGGPCPSCGYDLTGNVGGVWPECGKGVTLGR